LKSTWPASQAGPIKAHHCVQDNGAGNHKQSRNWRRAAQYRATLAYRSRPANKSVLLCAGWQHGLQGNQPDTDLRCASAGSTVQAALVYDTRRHDRHRKARLVAHQENTCEPSQVRNEDAVRRKYGQVRKEEAPLRENALTEDEHAHEGKDAQRKDAPLRENALTEDEHTPRKDAQRKETPMREDALTEDDHAQREDALINDVITEDAYRAQETFMESAFSKEKTGELDAERVQSKAGEHAETGKECKSNEPLNGTGERNACNENDAEEKDAIPRDAQIWKRGLVGQHEVVLQQSGCKGFLVENSGSRSRKQKDKEKSCHESTQNSTVSVLQSSVTVQVTTRSMLSPCKTPYTSKQRPVDVPDPPYRSKETNVDGPDLLTWEPFTIPCQSKCDITLSSLVPVAAEAFPSEPVYTTSCCKTPLLFPLLMSYVNSRQILGQEVPQVPQEFFYATSKDRSCGLVKITDKRLLQAQLCNFDMISLAVYYTNYVKEIHLMALFYNMDLLMDILPPHWTWLLIRFISLRLREGGCSGADLQKPLVNCEPREPTETSTHRQPRDCVT